MNRNWQISTERNFWTNVSKTRSFANSSLFECRRTSLPKILVSGVHRNILQKEVRACKDNDAELDDAVNKAREDLKRNIPQKAPPIYLVSYVLHHGGSDATAEDEKQTDDRRLKCNTGSPLLNTKGHLAVLVDIKGPECVYFCLK